MPRSRLLPTLLNFDVAVLVFLLLDTSLGINYSIQDTFLAFSGWTSIGNSNCYIFVIIALYFITYIMAIIFRSKPLLLLCGVTICICMLWILLVLTKESNWHTTLFSYDAGVLFSLYKDKIVAWIQKNYFFAVFLTFILCIGLFYMPFNYAGIASNALGVSMALFVVIISMKIRVKSKALEWLGKNLFPLYIYQRIPMILFSTVLGGGIIVDWPVLYILLCVCVTLLFGYLYKYIDIRFT